MSGVRNTRNGLLLAARIDVADSFLDRLKGLMGKKGLPEGAG
ncbi:MAG: hypothetical protein HW403_1466, partial [Dehalococcoidia bacterium]|nr:hypothetical protein [Dehalococcoidia bacterium]